MIPSIELYTEEEVAEIRRQYEAEQSFSTLLEINQDRLVDAYEELDREYCKRVAERDAARCMAWIAEITAAAWALVAIWLAFRH